MTEIKSKQPYGSTGIPRRVMGITCIVAGVFISVMDVFSTYTANERIVEATYAAGFLLLGIGIAKHFSKKEE